MNLQAHAIARLVLPLCFTIPARLAFSAPAVATPPNIVFILADDMGYADAGCYGQKHIQTPNLDRMAREGMRFTQCYAGSPVCAPSRSVLMTGLHTGHTRVRGNFGKGGVIGLGGGEGRVPLKDSDLTVAEVLKTAGYTTGMTGKWGLGEPGTSGLPNDQGFDAWFGFLNQRRAHTYYPDYLWLNEQRFDLPGNTEKRQQQYVHDLFTGFALHFIRTNREKPFFLYLPYTVPHSKFEIPDLGLYEDREWKGTEKAYAAMITRMDGDVGRILGLLKELDIDDRTIVFFASDNGAADRYDGRFDSSGPLRGRKRDMYEGGLRSPMLVRWPGHVPSGVTSHLVWSFVDFLPTAAELAGAKVPAGIDGASVLPTLLGKTQDLSDRFLYWEFFGGGFQQAARWKNWKVVRRRRDASLELYDLKTDLAEKNDIATSQPDVVRKFEEYLKTARTESEEWPVE